MNKRRPIKGSQTPTPTPTPLDPNDLAPECIKVDKVYDWVFFSNQDENKNFIPDEQCRKEVSEALAAGIEVNVKCFPADPEDVECRAKILEHGNPGRVSIVWTVPVRIKIFIKKKKICSFTVRTQFQDEVMLCVPEGIKDKHIHCKATDVQCSSSTLPLMGPDPFGPMIPVRVLLCKDVQVEFPVKLEVLGKFCFPRPNDIPVPNGLECPLDAFEFPPQCDFFPVDNCECQATALARNEETFATFGTDGTIVTGTSTLEAEICQECALANSRFTYSFTDTDEDGPTPTPTPTPTPSPDFSFTFEPTTIDEVLCNTEAGSLSVFGEGERSFNGTPEHVFYELRIFSDLAGFQLILRNTAGAIVFDSGIVDALVRFDECDTFADLLNNNVNGNG
ncbi:hypothetical protein [Alteribacillus bidgolensis]|uniref:DUF3794 domain-containing protein n=1 Tax=Alteribacillus bidgolensis TaxID=930129 RepID=A0A1G8QB98_9BACI|nr:hypothetical protein [Alteribacillus bidgolensis]SDJ01981.1 hypothetical protein SAMN05216352_1196 [Alteribacillus bidgolensis]